MKHRELRAFHNDPKIQAHYLEKVEYGYKYDQFRQGFYMHKGDSRADDRYCAVGCILRDPNGGHAQYPAVLGIPEELARLQDRIFEALSYDDAKTWALQFMTVIPLGADLSRVTYELSMWVLTNESIGLAKSVKERDKPLVADGLCELLKYGEDGFSPDALRSIGQKLLRNNQPTELGAHCGAIFCDLANASPDGLPAIDAYHHMGSYQLMPDPKHTIHSERALVIAEQLLMLLADAPVPEPVAA